MKGKIADSVILSSANLVILGFVYRLSGVTDPHNITLVLAVLVLPVTFLFTLGYTVRDLIRPGMRIQAILAVALSVPTAIFLKSIRID